MVSLPLRLREYNQEESKKYYVDGTNILSISSGKIASNNTSGVRGVTWHRRRQLWLARIIFKGQTIHLGYFEKLEDAAKARALAEEKYFAPEIEKFKDNSGQ